MRSYRPCRESCSQNVTGGHPGNSHGIRRPRFTGLGSPETGAEALSDAPSRDGLHADRCIHEESALGTSKTTAQEKVGVGRLPTVSNKKGKGGALDLALPDTLPLANILYSVTGDDRPVGDASPRRLSASTRSMMPEPADHRL